MLKLKKQIFDDVEKHFFVLKNDKLINRIMFGDKHCDDQIMK